MSSVLRSVRKRKKGRRLGAVDVIDREEYAELEVDAKVELIRSLVLDGGGYFTTAASLESGAPMGSRTAGQFFGLRGTDDPDVESPVSPAEEAVAAPSERPPEPEPEAPTGLPPSATPLAGAPSPQVTEAAAVGPLTIDIHPAGPCWVSLTIDGQRVFARILDSRRVSERCTKRETRSSFGSGMRACLISRSTSGRAARWAGVGRWSPSRSIGPTTAVSSCASPLAAWRTAAPRKVRLMGHPESTTNAAGLRGWHRRCRSISRGPPLDVLPHLRSDREWPFSTACPS